MIFKHENSNNSRLSLSLYIYIHSMNRLITRNNKYYNYKDNYCVKCKLYQTSLNHKDFFFFLQGHLISKIEEKCILLSTISPPALGRRTLTPIAGSQRTDVATLQLHRHRRIGSNGDEAHLQILVLVELLRRLRVADVGGSLFFREEMS